MKIFLIFPLFCKFCDKRKTEYTVNIWNDYFSANLIGSTGTLSQAQRSDEVSTYWKDVLKQWGKYLDTYSINQYRTYYSSVV